MTTDRLTSELSKWQTLIDLLTYFRTEQRCREFLLRILYPDGIRCPKCGGMIVYECKHGTYHCDECNNSFSIKVGTMFQSTKLPLRKWFAAIWLTINNKKSVSAKMLQREIGVSYVTAWHILQRIRVTLPQSNSPLVGTTQIDCAYLGGQYRWLAYKGKDYTYGSYLRNKVSLVGLSADRLVIKHISEGNWSSIKPIVRSLVPRESVIYTDQGHEFLPLTRTFGNIHLVCNHDSKQYRAPNGATTNRVEGAWAHLKGQRRGIFHKISHSYAQRYVDEFVWRWNTADLPVEDRVKKYFEGIRVVITWKQLKIK